MGAMMLPHVLDIYTAGGSPTLVKAFVAGYIAMLSAEERVRLQEVSQKPLARLWLGLAERSAVAEGRQIFWRERASWWTIRGAPEVHDLLPPGHIAALLAANAADGFFDEPQGPT